MRLVKHTLIRNYVGICLNVYQMAHRLMAMTVPIPSDNREHVRYTVVLVSNWQLVSSARLHWSRRQLLIELPPIFDERC